MRSTRRRLESGRDRRALAADAGLGSLSVASILAGVLVAYGAFAVLIGVAAAVVDALNVKTDIVSTDYERLGIVGGLIVAAIVLIAYLFGGYTAGRMARRAGLLNGALVAVLGLVIAGAVAALVRASDAETINTGLRSLGVPTTADEYGQAFSVAGIASLSAILVGSLLGGAMGERWHGKLLARAVDPTVGTEAEARKRAAADLAKAEEERTLAFERARTTNPSRARRSDRDALTAEERRVVDGDLDPVMTTTSGSTSAARAGPAHRNGQGDSHLDDASAGSHNRAASTRVLTGRAGPADPEPGGDNTVVGNRSVATGGEPRADVDSVDSAHSHRRFRRHSLRKP